MNSSNPKECKRARPDRLRSGFTSQTTRQLALISQGLPGFARIAFSSVTCAFKGDRFPKNRIANALNGQVRPERTSRNGS